MVVIISQNRKTIVNAEAIESISYSGNGLLTAVTQHQTVLLGTYRDPHNAVKIINYLGFFMGAAKDGCKTIILPSENVVAKDREIAETLINAMRENKEGANISSIELAPEIEEYLRKRKGGDE